MSAGIDAHWWKSLPAPELVEVGIATDAIFAIIIMAIVAMRIYTCTHTLNADELSELKG